MARVAQPPPAKAFQPQMHAKKRESVLFNTFPETPRIASISRSLGFRPSFSAQN
jgi:hypothetical protein